MWLSWWPLVLALLATPLAVRAASVLALSGPKALQLLYPFVALVRNTSTLRVIPAEWVLWAQFPAYGVLAVLIGRRQGVPAGIFTVLLLHLAAAGIDALTARG